MPRADELSFAIGSKRKQKQRHKLRAQRFFAEQPVHPVQHLLQPRPCAEFRAEGPEYHRAQQRRRHSFAGHIRQNPHPFPGTQLQKVVKIPPDISCRFIEPLYVEILELRQKMRKQAFLRLLRQRRLLLVLLLLRQRLQTNDLAARFQLTDSLFQRFGVLLASRCSSRTSRRLRTRAHSSA